MYIDTLSRDLQESTVRMSIYCVISVKHFSFLAVLFKHSICFRIFVAWLKETMYNKSFAIDLHVFTVSRLASVM